MEILQRIELLAGAGQLDRRAGDRAHGKGGTAAGIPVHPRHHNAGHAQRLVERLGGVHRVLAGHRIDHQQRFRRVGGVADFLHLRHQRFVDRQAPGGIEDHDVEHFAARRVHRAPGDLNRRLEGNDLQAGHACPFGELLQLQLRGRALGIQAGQQHLLALPVLQPQRQLAGGGGLAGALQTGHQDGHRRHGIQVDLDRTGAAKRLDQRVVDDLDDLLARRDRAQNLGADRAFAHLGDEIAHHFQRDVSLQERQANLAQRLGNIGLAQRASAAQLVEDPGQLVG